MEYRCPVCKYILCKECLSKLIHLNCPQCRNEIVLTDNQKLIIRNNLENTNPLPLQISNVTVDNFQQSRGFYIINRYINNNNITNIYNNFFYCLCFIWTIIYPGICYFIGYIITGSHKYIMGNLFLGFLFSLMFVLILGLLINMISNCFNCNS